MDRRSILVVVLCIVIVAAAVAVAVMKDDGSDAPRMPSATDMGQYDDGIYSVSFEGSGVVVTQVPEDYAWSSDVILIGGGWAEHRNPVALGSSVMDALSNGRTVASTDPSVFDCLRNEVPYSLETDASLVAVTLDADSGTTMCFSGTAPEDAEVLELFGDWYADKVPASLWFGISGDWDSKVQSDSRRVLDDWGTIEMTGFYGSSYASSTPIYASVHFVRYNNDGGPRMDALNPRMQAEGLWGLEGGPDGSWYNTREDPQEVIAASNAYIVWDYIDVGLELRSSMSEGLFDIEYDLSDWGNMYHTDFTYGTSYLDSNGVGYGMFEDGLLTIALSMNGHSEEVVCSTETSLLMPVFPE